MARYNKTTIENHLNIGNNAATTAVKGKAFEDLVCYLFDRVPGVEITQRNTMNVFNTEEIDVAVWNDKKPNGLYFLPHIILIECKNWSNPVSSNEVNWFASKLESRGRDFGILVANNGITGNAVDLTAAHNIIARHLERGRQIVVISRDEINQFQKTNDLVMLIKEKLCRIAVSGVI
ncbi:MAG: restriction endonuclease [Nanoarchaeota archaeon]|nr:restriction endonuclease [Nanoarchaeota archaeon]